MTYGIKHLNFNTNTTFFFFFGWLFLLSGSLIKLVTVAMRGEGGGGLEWGQTKRFYNWKKLRLQQILHY